ncbi:MAG: prolipoprotein diacylglyceryl transferase [Candidatus Andersenbacteria bacterium]
MSIIELLPSRAVLIRLNGVEIHWYGVLYVAAFWLAWWWLPKLQRYRSLQLSRDEWTVIVAAGAAGVLIGGRLGYILFYEPAFYFHNPAEIFAIWRGGMSSHGGFIGVGVALCWAARHLKTPLVVLLDVVAVPVAIGLALGRFGNWLNSELYIGNVALLDAAVHLSVAGVLFSLLQTRKTPGIVVAVFLVLYSIQRFIFEEFRVLEWPEMFGVTRGQILTIPVLLLGGWLLYQQVANSKRLE